MRFHMLGFMKGYSTPSYGQMSSLTHNTMSIWNSGQNSTPFVKLIEMEFSLSKILISSPCIQDFSSNLFAFYSTKSSIYSSLT